MASHLRLHEQVAAKLRRELARTGQPGQQLPADTSQAARFKVSVPTIRQALHLLCQEGLLERRHGSGTYVRDPVARTPVAVILPAAVMEGLASFFWLRTEQELRRLLSAAGCEVRVGIEGTLPVAAVRGMILLRYGPLLPPWPAALAASRLPVVSNDSRSKYAVTTDAAGLVRAGTQWLLDHGRRRVAMLTLDKYGDQRPDDYLYEAFAQTMSAARVPIHAPWVRGNISAQRAGHGWEQFRALWQGSAAKPDALLVADDTIYREVMPAILALGIRVPQDLLVVTHANLGAGDLYPFPTVRLAIDPVAYAQALVTHLLQLMRGARPARGQVTVPWHWQGVAEVEQALSCIATIPVHP